MIRGFLWWPKWVGIKGTEIISGGCKADFGGEAASVEGLGKEGKVSGVAMDAPS